MDQAEALYRLFPNSKREDKEAAKEFSRAVTKTLTHYPAEVIAFVCSAEGLPLQYDWPPTLKQVAEACDKRLAPMTRDRDREIQRQRQLADRHAEEERLAKAPKTGAVARYLAERRKDKNYPMGHTPGPAASAETLLAIYLDGRAKHKHRVTLSREARAIIEAAGLEIPA